MLLQTTAPARWFGGQSPQFAGPNTISGTYSKYFVIDSRAHASLLGVHFKPGVARSILGVPPGSLDDEHADLEVLWRAYARELRDRLGSAPTVAASAQDGTVTVRYQVADIDRAIAFYTGQLDFQPGERAGSMFASVRRGNLRLILGGPGSSGSRPMPDGRKQEPGGWNRILIYVEALEPIVQRLRAAGVHFRNDVEAGPGGKQILVDDPDGNPIELHQP